MKQSYIEILRNYLQEDHGDVAQTVYQSAGGGMYDSYGDPYFSSGEGKDSKIIQSALPLLPIFQAFMKGLEHAPVAKAVSTRR